MADGYSSHNHWFLRRKSCLGQHEISLGRLGVKKARKQNGALEPLIFYGIILQSFTEQFLILPSDFGARPKICSGVSIGFTVLVVGGLIMNDAILEKSDTTTRNDKHCPAVCGVAKMWLQTCKDDSKTANWIKSNMKECAKCQSMYYDCEEWGCNRASMNSVGFAWDPGRNMGCNGISATNIKRRRGECPRCSEQDGEYYNHWANHEQSAKFTLDVYAKREKKMEDIQITISLTWIDDCNGKNHQLTLPTKAFRVTVCLSLFNICPKMIKIAQRRV
ncbi:hypothetical protein C8J56DRAFT_1023925 [Mycena floridula]|nr:hypothetical protein C8J56DRAFT_1023925 [Mycena floridula]